MTEIELEYQIDMLAEMCTLLEPMLNDEKVLEISLEFATNDFELKVSTNDFLKKFLRLEYLEDEEWKYIYIDFNHPVPYAERIRKFILCEDKDNTYGGII